MLRFAIGIVELASLYKGFEVQDQILKNNRVEKLLARTICSGKYLIIFKGDVADVESGVRLADETGGFAVVNTLVISNVDERVFPAISGSVPLEPASTDGLLIIETFSVASAIQAADIAVKEADVVLLRVHVAMAIGGKGLVVMGGNIDALKSSQSPVLDYLKDEGTLAGYTLITQPHPDLLKDLI